MIQRGRRPMDAALVYARRGWAVFPCHSPTPAGGCSCRRADCFSPAKHPRVARGLHMATTEAWQIHSWWRRWPNANVAIRTGAISGLIVIDVDPRHGGSQTLEMLIDTHGPLPWDRVVETGSGGLHFYLAHPGGKVRNNAGQRLGPGIDIRGDGGYVIAPPSRHISGSAYTWTAKERSLPPAPEWLLDLLAEPRRNTPSRPNHDVPERLDAWARAALERELAAVRTACEGTRNNTLNRAAYSLGQIVAVGELDEGTVTSYLLDAACYTGLGEREALATVSSGLNAGMREPRVIRQRGPTVSPALGSEIEAPELEPDYLPDLP